MFPMLKYNIHMPDFKGRFIDCSRRRLAKQVKERIIFVLK